MKNFEDTGTPQSLLSKDLTGVNHRPYSPRETQSIFPPVKDTIEKTPTGCLETEKHTRSGKILGGDSSSFHIESTELSFVPCVEADVDPTSEPIVCVLDVSHNLSTKVTELLSPTLLPITNCTSLPPYSSDRSNVTLRKKPKPHFPTKPYGATEGGLAQFGMISPVGFVSGCSIVPSLPVSLNSNPDTVPLPTLRER
jgi:hypothetical protein